LRRCRERRAIDYGRDDLALSGIVLSATPGIASAPRDALEGLLPVVPTSLRDFLPTDRVTAFVRRTACVWDSCRRSCSPRASPTALDGWCTSGRPASRRRTSAPVDRPTSSWTFPRGTVRDSYQLTIEASLETIQRLRQVRFRVR
jgi:hypothetical protein